MSITLSFNWELTTINIEPLYQILWKSDRPVSITLEFLKNLGLFVSITSMHVVSFSIMQAWQKSIIADSFGCKLKSTMIIIFSYFEDKTSRATCISLKWATIKFLWGLYVQHNNHFLFLKFISIKRGSIFSCVIFRILQGISYLINTGKLPSNWFLSSLNGSEYPCNKNCTLGKGLSSFVSVVISMSILPVT